VEPDLDRTRDVQAPGQEQHTTAENADMRVHRGGADPAVLVPCQGLPSALAIRQVSGEHSHDLQPEEPGRPWQWQRISSR